MELFIICVLFAIAVGSAGYGVWRRFYLSPKAKKALYKDLERRAKTFAERFYHEKDETYYPVIFKWVSMLAAQEKDPAVWLLLGDLYASGCGTERDPKRALSSYEQALSADIASGRNTDLTKEAHDYLESCIIRLRKELSK